MPSASRLARAVFTELVGQLHTPDFAREVQRYIQYEPEPPYADG
jgi:hypothetical protein